MSKKTIRILVTCDGYERTPDRQQIYQNIRLSRALYFNGVNLSRRYCLEYPEEGYQPTGEYDIQITRHTPEIVNGERISSHDVQFAGMDHAYYFAASLTTTAMPQLKVKTQNMLRKMNLLKSPNGVDGYLDATVYGWFHGWTEVQVSVDKTWHEITVDTATDAFQFVGDYSFLSVNLVRVKFSVEMKAAVANWEKYQFVFRGSKLYVRYSDSKRPVIDQPMPSAGQVLIEDFTPSIGASFNDSGGAGIDTASFEMTIDRQSVSDQINVNAKTPGLSLSESGFRYRPPKDLTVGLHRVELSIADLHGNTQEANWYFRLRYDTPAILNLLPLSGTTVDTPRPQFSADFSDRGERGLDLDTFELIIDDRPPLKQGARGMLVNANGFSYRPPINLEAGEHRFSVRIADQSQRSTNLDVVFSVQATPINRMLGDLPLGYLQGIGATLEAQYAKQSGGAITSIKDLVNQNPQTLSDEIGLSLSHTIGHVVLADILCTRVAFNRMNFSELWDRSVWDIAHMTDQQIVDLDQPLDEEGNVIEEAHGDVAELRENIALLFICLDNPVLQTLTFGDIVSNQVEGTYYS